ncbi:MAG: xanthine dehydrogenase family protein subunit M [Planctomycetes bacterium]|jgi:xanthine dehydrogenase YagS FAD-binding subunit|nr:xanthine dehydrogenase family protein subunit M [Planctomycetota bacterium]MBT7641085.1 xanthine dehydrogenase family protein subunit M [Planctomycetota bacterium]
MKQFKVALPGSIEQASSLQQSSDAPFIAGGTDLLARIKEYITTPEMVVDLKRIGGLGEITSTDHGVRIGALVTMNDVATNLQVREGFPALAETIGNAATPQIRNMATIGGNICQKPRCWYLRHEGYTCAKNGGSGCWAREGENEFHAIFGNQVCAMTQPSNVAPVLVAYGASIEIQSNAESLEKREVPADQFFLTPEQDPTREVALKPGEIVTAVLLPAKNRTEKWSYTEAREKQSFDWAQASVTVLYQRGGRRGDHRVVLGAVSPAPLRRADLEQIIAAGDLDADCIQALQKKIGEGANPLSQNGYKVPMLRGLMAKAIRKLNGEKKEG